MGRTGLAVTDDISSALFINPTNLNAEKGNSIALNNIGFTTVLSKIPLGIGLRFFNYDYFGRYNVKTLLFEPSLSCTFPISDRIRVGISMLSLFSTTSALPEPSGTSSAI